MRQPRVSSSHLLLASYYVLSCHALQASPAATRESEAAAELQQGISAAAEVLQSSQPGSADVASAPAHEPPLLDVEPVGAPAPREAFVEGPPLATEQAADPPVVPDPVAAEKQEQAIPASAAAVLGAAQETAHPVVDAAAPAEQPPAKAPSKNQKRGGKKRGKGGRR